MKIEEISIQFKAPNPKSKITFTKNLISLLDQIESALILEGPYRLVLDSNIIMRLESYRQGNISEGLLSILLTFKLIKNYLFISILAIDAKNARLCWASLHYGDDFKLYSAS